MIGSRWIAGMGLVGCSDSLLGAASIDARIGGEPLPPGAAWEVRWAHEGGLTVGCEPVDAGVDTERYPVDGAVVVAPPALPDPDDGSWVDRGAYRYALALLVLVGPGTAPPPAGDGLDSLEGGGVWGVSAPIAWLRVDGDRAAAGAHLVDGGLEAPVEAWVEADVRQVDDTGTFAGSLRALPGLGELRVTALSWASDPAYFVWSGDSLGGIGSSCAATGP